MLQFQSADVRPIVEPNQSPLMDPINLSHPHLNYPLQLGCVPCSGKWSRRNISGAVFTSSLIVPVSPLIDFHYFLVIAASQEARRIAANDFSRPPRTGSLLQHHYQHHHCHRPIAFNFFQMLNCDCAQNLNFVQEDQAFEFSESQRPSAKDLKLLLF